MKIIEFIFLLGWSQLVLADDHENLAAHVHGLVEMSLVAEANIVEINIESPLMNLVGFEYQAQTEAEKEEVQNMIEIFKAPEKWLRFIDTANCQLTQQLVDYGEEAHHEHKHEKEETLHSELQASYQFTCAVNRLSSLEVLLQNHFPAIESIELSWIMNNQAGITILHHGEKQVHLKHE